MQVVDEELIVKPFNTRSAGGDMFQIEKDATRRQYVVDLTIQLLLSFVWLMVDRKP